MGGLILLSGALGIIALTFMALYLVQCRRARRLAEQMEDFLTSDQSPLEFSVREDSFAPLHNAAAEMENRLLIAREQLREELKRTSTLTADISHQLKTPLASLRLFCELDGGAHLDQQMSQIERMERLIYSLLRLERLCADGYEFKFVTHDVEKIVADAWESLAASRPDRKLTIRGSARIRCDEKWMGEAFVNLLKNACEHTQPGGRICVQLETTETSFYATVSDDGGGVSPKELPHLFERFYRAGKKETGGAGIGLAIVQEIIYRHHGHIRAENADGGLKFTISIPILNLLKP